MAHIGLNRQSKDAHRGPGNEQVLASPSHCDRPNRKTFDLTGSSKFQSFARKRLRPLFCADSVQILGGYVGKFKYLLLVAVATFYFGFSTQKSQAQIAVQIGPPPECPYGYFDYAPYECAPYGYYGPEWFSRGVFVGAGPWYHGRRRFWGHVDNRYDRHDGWHGEYPRRGERYDQHRRPGRYERFRGNEMRDGHGHSRLGREHEHRDDHERREHEHN
jgi:hypothetical protein